jgi:hypothetical protein
VQVCRTKSLILSTLLLIAPRTRGHSISSEFLTVLVLRREWLGKFPFSPCCRRSFLPLFSEGFRQKL